LVDDNQQFLGYFWAISAQFPGIDISSVANALINPQPLPQEDKTL
jgi:hypothetical protein